MDQEKKKLDLSVAQVSGSAIAAVVAAKLASTLGVYGTILGAGVISVIATCGGSLFQHLFKRTGEQIRVATVHGERAEIPVTVAAPTSGSPPAPLHDGASPARGGGRSGGASGADSASAADGESGEEFGAATMHGTRVRGWKRSAVAAALVFLVSMGGITAYELISDQDFSGTQGRTTFGSVVRGGDAGPDAPSTEDPATPRPGGEEGPARKGSPEQDPEKGGDQEGSSPSPDAGRTTPEAPDPDPTPSDPAGGGDPAPTPTPSTATPTPTPTGSPSGDAPAQGAPPAE
ncbi:hypothetical protein ACWGIN_29000 [Streptomyces sp. NPDC054861]